jgi:hypothetical protein
VRLQLPWADFGWKLFASWQTIWFDFHLDNFIYAIPYFSSDDPIQCAGLQRGFGRLCGQGGGPAGVNLTIFFRFENH